MKSLVTKCTSLQIDVNNFIHTWDFARCEWDGAELVSYHWDSKEPIVRSEYKNNFLIAMEWAALEHALRKNNEPPFEAIA